MYAPTLKPQIMCEAALPLKTNKQQKPVNLHSDLPFHQGSASCLTPFTIKFLNYVNIYNSLMTSDASLLLSGLNFKLFFTTFKTAALTIPTCCPWLISCACVD